MHRRDLLKGAAALPLAATLAPLAAAAASASRVRPSDPAWPSAARWEALKQQLGGESASPQAAGRRLRGRAR